MTSERLIYRSLGVPDVIADESKVPAAARRVAEAAGLDVAVDPNRSEQSQVRLADATSVVIRACELAAAGELDGFASIRCSRSGRPRAAQSFAFARSRMSPRG